MYNLFFCSKRSPNSDFERGLYYRRLSLASSYILLLRIKKFKKYTWTSVNITGIKYLSKFIQRSVK
ncbi:hypothetical protein WH47_10010 [Habropoda laboriosa]|uniref:Uncharacterized protein n=1 Tax=Habropoda laboriosa TaxID=597456 RepID=A0A0L7R3V7_9HYME|nr:hypothetical protein WH47_10010 [Habropoda laboriosa]